MVGENDDWEWNGGEEGGERRYEDVGEKRRREEGRNVGETSDGRQEEEKGEGEERGEKHGEYEGNAGTGTGQRKNIQQEDGMWAMTENRDNL